MNHQRQEIRGLYAKFDNSRGGTPAAFHLNGLIEGWIIAITTLCI